jgi:hypothetical protein
VRSVHVSRVIHADPVQVYRFTADPANLHLWAAGLAEAKIHRDGETLLVASPMGEVRVRFTVVNDLGVLDHDVTLPDGRTVNNPVRVLAHPEGAEIIFTVRQLGMDEEQFAADAAAVGRDLDVLKRLVELRGDGPRRS